MAIEILLPVRFADKAAISFAPCKVWAANRNYLLTVCVLRTKKLVNSEGIPEGYSSVTPYFTVENADRLIEFLKAAFDASIIKENRYPNQRVQHVRMLVGNSIIMMNEGSDDYPVNVSQMHLFVSDCDLTFEKALQSGAKPIMEPNFRPHGDRMAGIEDPCGCFPSTPMEQIGLVA